jgi:biopolymer transport protein ExbB/TolQ
MRKLFPTELIYQLFSLLIAFIVVHAVYVAVIRPNAEGFLAEERAKAKIDRNYEIQQSPYVILRDYEQEACFVLMIWALAIIGFKAAKTHRQRRQLEFDLVGLPEGTPVTVESAQQTSALIRKRLPEPMQDFLLPRVMLAAIDRFAATRSVQDASSVVHTLCDSEAERQESDLSIIRYIAWAIPSVGFIGTVRGIGNALAQAHKAVEGDITGVTDSLGVAFNSTFIALLISIVLMFLIHQLQSMQEKLVLDTRRYCDDWFVRRLKV